MTIRYPEVFTLLNGEVRPRCQEIEVASSYQIPHFQMIGLPGPEVSEAKDRVRSAIESSGFSFPKRKVVMNLSPASVRKEGTGIDLAMAVAILVENSKIEEYPGPFPAYRIFAWGELGLDGRVKAVGSPARAIDAASRGKSDLILVAENDAPLFRETATELFPEIDLPPILGVARLKDVGEILRGEPNPKSLSIPSSSSPSFPPSFSPLSPRLLPLPAPLTDLLQLAAAGAHHFLLLGPKGVGKSLALDWFLALQPPPDHETRRIRRFLAEISGPASESSHRRVSTQVKPAALLGSFSGGSFRPGEFSLAHGGVLLADEFLEWSRDAREALREPLERRRLTLTRVDGALDLPADFIFAGNGNLCPCGGSPEPLDSAALSPCRCHPLARERYLARLGGPILDRLDLVIRLFAPPTLAQMARPFPIVAGQTAQIRSRVVKRYGVPPGKLSPLELEDLLTADPKLRQRLDSVPYGSFRDRHKTLRIALTLAALRGHEEPDPEILLEARSLRLNFAASREMGRG